MGTPSSSKQRNSSKDDESQKSSRKREFSSRPHAPRKEEPTRELSCIEKGPECLGRSVLSWIFSAIYLICLWTVLGAIFLGCLWLLQFSLQDGPRFYGAKSFIGGDSRIQIKRWADIREEYASRRDSDDFTKKTRICNEGAAGDEKLPCRMEDAAFGKCHPSKNGTELSRCFAVRLNHIFGFVPLLNSSDALHFSCKTNGTDENDLEMWPENGLPLKYWDYSYSAEARKWYDQPVASLYINPSITGEINITCTAEASNISPNFASLAVTLEEPDEEPKNEAPAAINANSTETSKQ